MKHVMRSVHCSLVTETGREDQVGLRATSYLEGCVIWAEYGKYGADFTPSKKFASHF